MKRLLLTVALCVAASASFAQKKAVSQAESIAKGSNPDFTEARSLIKGALTDVETKDDAKTWYVAGFVEDAQFNQERMKQLLGQEPNEPVMYEALENILPYFEKSYELDQQPNDKGKVKPRFTKNIKGIINANHAYYMNGGVYYFEEGNYKKAYDFFNQYTTISDLPWMQGEPAATKDSTYMTMQFYAAIAAMQMNDPQTAIPALEKAAKNDYKLNDVYQYLFLQYQELDDKENMERVLREGMAKVPEESYYLLNLINLQIGRGEKEQALASLQTAISKDPTNTQLYNVVGQVYEEMEDLEQAESYYRKALDIDPNDPMSLSSMGRIYYNQAVNKLGEANMITDSRLYQEEADKAKEFFRQAMPYFEKAHSLNPEDSEPMTTLRTIYYNLQMGDKYEEMETKLNNR